MSNQQFNIHIETDIWLYTNDVWPDGDEPEYPTAEDVAGAMRDYGDKRKVLRDWELLDHIDTVEVSDTKGGHVADPWRAQ